MGATINRRRGFT